MENEQQQFLDEFKPPQQEDPFAFLNPQEPQPEEPKVEDKPADPEPRNRRERRLVEKLQIERESAIALAAKLEAITQSQQVRSESAEWEKAVEKIYGDSTPELREATELLKSAIRGATAETERRALAAYEERLKREQDAVTTAEKQIDTMLEELEDDLNIDLSSDSAKAHRTNFLTLMEKMSPKDSNGNIIAYADHFAVWDTYQERLKAVKPVNPAKEIVSRSMVQSTGNKESNLNNDVNERWLRENGII
jgi:hypothetical protein